MAKIKEQCSTTATVDYMKCQLHAGISSDGSTLWHTDSKGLYWCGDWSHRTPLQLLNECTTTIRDLLLSHPELINKQ